MPTSNITSFSVIPTCQLRVCEDECEIDILFETMHGDNPYGFPSVDRSYQRLQELLSLTKTEFSVQSKLSRLGIYNRLQEGSSEKALEGEPDPKAFAKSSSFTGEQKEEAWSTLMADLADHFRFVCDSAKKAMESNATEEKLLDLEYVTINPQPNGVKGEPWTFDDVIIYEVKDPEGKEWGHVGLRSLVAMFKPGSVRIVD